MKSIKSVTLLGLLSCAAIGRADPLDTWTPRGPKSSDIGLYCIAYGAGRYVALDSSGQVALISTDGVTWLQSPGPLTNANGTINAITYGAGQFLAVGDSGAVEISPDGTNWTEHPSGSLASLGDVAYGNGTFVAVPGVSLTEASSTILASLDGTNWIPSSVSITNVNGGFAAVAYGNGRFVASAESGAIVTSTDGLNWLGREPGEIRGFRSIAYGDGKFVGVGIAAVCCPTLFTFISTSADGLTWTESTETYSFYNSRVAFGNGLFVVIGSGPTSDSGPSVLISPDGVDWFHRQSGSTNWLWGIVYGDGHFMTVGDRGTILESGSVIRLGLASQDRSGSLQLSVTGPSGTHYTIESSTNLTSWQIVTNVATVESSTFVLDVLPATSDRAYYRAYSQ